MSNPVALYRHYDKFRCLLYVGISHNPLSRFGDHSRSSFWSVHVTVIEVEWKSSREKALAAEKSAIVLEKPFFNIIHNCEWNVLRAFDNYKVALNEKKKIRSMRSLRIVDVEGRRKLASSFIRVYDDEEKAMLKSVLSVSEMSTRVERIKELDCHEAVERDRERRDCKEKRALDCMSRWDQCVNNEEWLTLMSFSKNFPPFNIWLLKIYMESKEALSNKGFEVFKVENRVELVNPSGFHRLYHLIHDL